MRLYAFFVKMEFIKSSHGKPLLVYNGNVYRRYRSTASRIYWRCIKSADECLQCRATLVTDEIDGETRILKSSDHCHGPDPIEIDRMRAINGLKESAKSTRQKSSIMIQDLLTSSDQEVAATLPSINALKCSIARQRKDKASEPTSLDFDVDGEDILADLRVESERYIIFGRRQSLDLMSRSEFWMMDGTFKTCPRLFHQIYSIHVSLSGHTFPCLFVLMTNRTEDAYRYVFDEILAAAARYDLELRPKFILTDFELAAINASKVSFQPEQHCCCLFHLGQIINRRIQEIGVSSRYIEDRDFNLAVRKLAAMAFLQPYEIYQAFEQMKEGIDCPELTDWFDANYINGRVIRRRASGAYIRLPPRYPPSLWSVNSLMTENYSRTQNNVEGWHNRLATLAGSCHIGFYRFVDLIAKELKRSEVEFNKFIAGSSRQTKRKYLEKEKRLKNIFARKPVMSIDEFLFGIAVNLKV